MSETTDKRTTIEELEANILDRPREAAGRYRELLLRNEAPRTGDAAKLVDVMAVLGRQPDDLAKDLELAQRLAECEQAEKASRELKEPLAAARPARDELQHQHEAQQQRQQKKQLSEMAGVAGAFNKLQGQMGVAITGAQDAVDLRGRWTSIAEGISMETVRARRKRTG